MSVIYWMHARKGVVLMIVLFRFLLQRLFCLRTAMDINSNRLLLKPLRVYLLLESSLNLDGKGSSN